METTEELNIRVSFNRKNVLFLLVLFFLCWHPGFIGSESLTLTTYYPAPYGGYVRILTTNQTLLARDGGNVGVRTGAVTPRTPLDVNGEIATASRMTLAQNMASNSLTWHLDNAGGRFRVFQQPNITTAGTERMTILSGNGFVGINTTNPQQRLHVLNGNIQVENGNLNIMNGHLSFSAGNGTTSGLITGLCSSLAFSPASGSSCVASFGAGYRVMAIYGDASSTCNSGGSVFLGGDLQNPARWRAETIPNCRGTMLCCRIRDW